jgi:hypothetical protein
MGVIGRVLERWPGYQERAAEEHRNGRSLPDLHQVFEPAKRTVSLSLRGVATRQPSGDSTQRPPRLREGVCVAE